MSFGLCLGEGVWDAAPLHFNLAQPKCETRGLVGEGEWFFQLEEAGGLLELVFGSRAGREAVASHGPAFRQEQSWMGREQWRL